MCQRYLGQRKLEYRRLFLYCENLHIILIFPIEDKINIAKICEILFRMPKVQSIFLRHFYTYYGSHCQAIRTMETY